MKSKIPTVLLLDLGGVLIDLNWREKAEKLFSSSADEDELKSKWLNLQSVRFYESGKITFTEFYESFVAETGNEIAFSDFQNEFCGIIGELKKDCCSILEKLKSSYRLAMLSNTNEMHVQMLRQRSDIFSYFQHLFFSYELKMVKPDHEIFHEICLKLDLNANDIAFFDDSAVNVAAASECGLRAFRVDSPEEIYSLLEHL